MMKHWICLQSTGALNLTREAQKGSLKAQQIADGSEEQVAEAERYYKRTEARINRTANQFEEEREGNSRFLVTLSEKLKELELDIPDLNEKVCDKRGDPCDQLCGGAGCGSCGGLLSCEQGAVTKADTTVQLAEDAKQAIKEKEAQAEGLLRKISQAKQDTLTAHNVAKGAYDAAVLVRNRSENTIEESRDVTKRIQDFMETPKATPANIRDLAEEDTDEAIRHIIKLKRDDKKNSTACNTFTSMSHMSLWAQPRRLEEVHQVLLYCRLEKISQT
uniref:Uncharacterized protein n=1 Tax=Timema tahoe TaxID=61484 RepID=A0A7R9ICF5_9NEOP|nr:unnamed protein product [Timema tahoe]